MNRFVRASASALALVVVLGGCPRKKDAGADAGSATAMGELVVKDASEGLLLTWIDEKGDFHVEQRVADVPLAGRDAVRVVDPNRDEGTHADKVFVADLRNARPDGTYAVRESTRAEFDALALGRRQKHGLTLASPWDGGALALQPTTPEQAPSPNAPSDPQVTAPVVIYGASWCGACHKAAEYLRQKGIPFVEKDIEQDSAAAREMQRKLVKNGLRSGSIPVIDVRGKVMVGFNADEIDAALGKAS